MSRGGSRPDAPRLARCGHLTPYNGGPQRHLCNDCAQPPKRACASCSTDITTSRGNRKYCSEHCANVARGKAIAAPLAPRTCALAECDAVFRPRRDEQRCCSERHGKTLWNRRARRHGAILSTTTDAPDRPKTHGIDVKRVD